MADYCNCKLTITSKEDGFVRKLYFELILAPKALTIHDRIAYLFGKRKKQRYLIGLLDILCPMPEWLDDDSDWR